MSPDQADEAEIALIRDELLEQIKQRADAEKEKANKLHEAVQKREEQLAALEIQKKAAEEENVLIKKQKEEAQAEANNKIASQNAEMEALKLRMGTMEEAERARNQAQQVETARRQQRGAITAYLGLLFGVLVISLVCAWQAVQIFPWYAKILGPFPAVLIYALIIFVFGHLVLEILIGRKSLIAQLWPFKKVKRFRKTLWTVVCISFFGGVFGNLYANRIQKNIDDEHVLTTNAAIYRKDSIARNLPVSVTNTPQTKIPAK